MLQLVVGNMGWTLKNKLEKWDHIFCVGQLSTKKLEKYYRFCWKKSVGQKRLSRIETNWVRCGSFAQFGHDGMTHFTALFTHNVEFKSEL